MMEPPVCNFEKFQPWLRPEDNGTLIPNVTHTCSICGGRPVHYRNGSVWMCERCYKTATRKNGGGQKIRTVEITTVQPEEMPQPEGTEPSWSYYTAEEIHQMDDKRVAETLWLFEKNFGIRPPKNYDLLPPDDLKEWIQETAQSEMLHAAVVRDQMENIKKRYMNLYTVPTKDGFKLNYIAISDHIKEVHDIETYADDIRIYKDGIYVPNQNVVEEEVKKIARAVSYEGNISTAVREVIHYLIGPYGEYPYNREPDAIPVLNGVVKLDYANFKMALLPHDPKYKFTYKLPITYDPEADGSVVDQVLRAWVIPEGCENPQEYENLVELLYQIPAQALLQAQGRGKTYKKAYLLKGLKDAGKTTYAVNLINLFFGVNQISRVSLQSIGGDKFALVGLENKLINVHDDLDSIPLKQVGTFKMVTGSTEIRVERKNKDAYNAPVHAVHLFTCNDPPKVPAGASNDEAFWGRWEYIIFPNQFDVDPSFIDRTFTEENKSGFLNEVIRRMFLIKANGNRLMNESTAEEVQTKWLLETNPVYKFIDGEMVKDLHAAFRKEDLYGIYVQWCRDNRANIEKENKFAMYLYQFGFSTTRAAGKGKREQLYRGYKFKLESKYFVRPYEKDKTL